MAIVLTPAVTGCGGGGDSGGDTSGRRITVASLPLADDAPLYLAQERGLFEKEGLDVRIQPVRQSIQALPALAKGQVDVKAIDHILPGLARTTLGFAAAATPGIAVGARRAHAPCNPALQ